METNDTSVADGIETNGTRANLETNEVSTNSSDLHSLPVTIPFVSS